MKAGAIKWRPHDRLIPLSLLLSARNSGAVHQTVVLSVICACSSRGLDTLGRSTPLELRVSASCDSA